MKPSRNEIKARILICGEELAELQRQSFHFSESFGLDSRIGDYQGKRPISFSDWDFDSLFPVLEFLLDDPTEYPDKMQPRYISLKNLYHRLKSAYAETFGIHGA